MRVCTLHGAGATDRCVATWYKPVNKAEHIASRGCSCYVSGRRWIRRGFSEHLMKKVVMPCALAWLSLATPSYAYESHEVTNRAGRSIFELRFFNPEDGAFFEYEGEQTISK